MDTTTVIFELALTGAAFGASLVFSFLPYTGWNISKKTARIGVMVSLAAFVAFSALVIHSVGFEIGFKNQTAPPWAIAIAFALMIGSLTWIVGNLSALSLTDRSFDQFNESALQVIEALQQHQQVTLPQIKIVASDEGYLIAQFLVRCFKVAGYTCVNTDEGNFVFPARVEHDQVILRVRKSSPQSTAMIVGLIYTGLSRIGIESGADDFPESDKYDYIQIEVYGEL